MKTEELKNIIKESITREIKNAILEGISGEVYIIKNKQGEPIEQFETEEEAQKALETYKKDNPDQELIIEPGEKLSFEELDKMSEKLENMENINETKHKGHFTIDQVTKLANKAGNVISEAKEDLMELCEAYEGKVPAQRVFDILEDYDMSELTAKIKKVEPAEGNAFSAARAEAIKNGEDEFTVDGKTYPVQDADADEAMDEEEECYECGSDMKEYDEDDDHKKTYYHVLQDSGYGEIGYQGVYDTEEEAKSRVNSLTDMFPNSFFYVEASNSENEPYSVTSSDYNPDDDIDEGQGGMCEKCGKELCECGSMTNESKKSIRLNESDLIKLIKKMVSEAVPGVELQQTVHKQSGKENDDALSDVEKKIKEFLNFDGNDNPEFPNQIGGEVKARRADDEESEEVADNRGGGLEDLIYDVDPSKEAQDRHEKALKGDTKMGNSQDAANVIPSKLGEKIIKKVKRKDKQEASMKMYNKDVQPSREVKESKEESKKVISEEIQRIKQMASYNKKTQ